MSLTFVYLIRSLHTDTDLIGPKHTVSGTAQDRINPCILSNNPKANLVLRIDLTVSSMYSMETFPALT